MYVCIYLSIHIYRREPKGGFLKGGLHFYDFSFSNANPLVSNCAGQVEVFNGHCLCFVHAPLCRICLSSLAAIAHSIRHHLAWVFLKTGAFGGLSACMRLW